MSRGMVTALVSGRIRRARKERGLTAQALADRITGLGYRVSREVIAKIENGTREAVPVDVVVHAAKVLQVPVLRLLSDGPWCERCGDAPPSGFACTACGAAS